MEHIVECHERRELFCCGVLVGVIGLGLLELLMIVTYTM